MCSPLHSSRTRQSATENWRSAALLPSIGREANDAHKFLVSGQLSEIPADWVRDEIRSSWQRCLDANLDPNARPESTIIQKTELKALREQSAKLHEIAKMEVRNLYSQIAGSNFMVAFANQETIILEAIADDSFQLLARRGGILPGSRWSEQLRGTNALGCSAWTKSPAVVHASEHFFSDSCNLTCIASPVFDHEDRLLGVIDASSDCHARQLHTVALIQMAALQIEAEYFRDTFRQNIILQFHNRTEFVHTLEAGLIALGKDGRIIAANRQARFFLHGLPVAPGRTFDRVFRISFDRFLHQTAASGSGDLIDDRGSTYKVLVSNLHKHIPVQAGVAFPALADRRRSQPKLVCEDPAVIESLRLIENAVAWRVPILIRGETGCGKELMARHAHNASKRSGKFVAVNCTALPETLVESEFFGYREGAFTGGRRGGAPGLIRDADRGTLFLDEIGDMPVALQARLLRFLDQWTVRAVGSSVEQEVDVQVIAATNSPLEREVAAGKFRTDLLYRLQGMEVTIPPLRERSDFVAIVYSVLKSLSPESFISTDALEALRQHNWPGNFRELRNTLLRILITTDSTTLNASNVLSVLKMRNGIQPCAPPAAQAQLKDGRTKMIMSAYHHCHGNIVKTAKELGVSRNTVYRELRKQGVV
jgi:transcriptional regulator of acetoin/glycerol metabolism